MSFAWLWHGLAAVCLGRGDLQCCEARAGHFRPATLQRFDGTLGFRGVVASVPSGIALPFLRWRGESSYNSVRGFGVLVGHLRIVTSLSRCMGVRKCGPVLVQGVLWEIKTGAGSNSRMS